MSNSRRMRAVTSPWASLRRRYPMPYAPDSSPENAHSTITRADRPSTRSASLNAAGMVPSRDCPAVARERANVTDSPPSVTASFTRRGRLRAPSAAVSSGTTSIRTSSATSPFQLGEPADVHRLEPVDDPPHENAEDEHRQNDVERDAQLDD